MSEDVKDKLNYKLKNAKVLSHREKAPGIHEVELAVENKPLGEVLPFLTGKDGQRSPIRLHHTKAGQEQAADVEVISRDYLRRSDVDLLIGQKVLGASPQKLYKRALEYYRTKGAYGTVIDTLTNFASKGFKNDIDDPDIRLFYDVWIKEINFRKTVENIFFDFFRVGLVRTLKTVGKFEPKLKPSSFTSVVNSQQKASYKTAYRLQQVLSTREYAAAKKTWSKRYIPLRYTILDPQVVDIQGPTLFDQTDTYLKPEAFTDLKKLIEQTEKTAEEKEFISSLPEELRSAISEGKPIRLPRELVGKCDYRRQDYERYPLPRVVRAFDSIDYKEELERADFSTLDGITNYILKITIGNDEYPVQSQEELETVAQLFDTTSKSFDIVWNHTLKVEKITFPEISEILGQDKFLQVNDELSQSFGVTRALLDGAGSAGAKAVEVGTKAFIEEINYARGCVTDWIEREYEEVALAMGFERYPKIRFDDLALKDEIMMMSIVQGLIDRRVISYETGIEKLGFDFQTELANMQQELPLVQAGILGIIGSPYNPKALPPSGPVPDKDATPEGYETVLTQKDLQDFMRNIETMIQEVQRTPKGTPSEGRPRRGFGKPRQKAITPVVPKPRKPNTGVERE